jgi:hypothetical protein
MDEMCCQEQVECSCIDVIDPHGGVTVVVLGR